MLTIEEKRKIWLKTFEQNKSIMEGRVKSDIENRCKGGLFHNDLTPKKSALMLKKLMNEIWHTEETFTTDENGFVEFRGFYGDYEVNVNGKTKEFGIHKNEDNSYCVQL